MHKLTSSFPKLNISLSRPSDREQPKQISYLQRNSPLLRLDPDVLEDITSRAINIPILDSGKHLQERLEKQQDLPNIKSLKAVVGTCQYFYNILATARKLLNDPVKLTEIFRKSRFYDALPERELNVIKIVLEQHISTGLFSKKIAPIPQKLVANLCEALEKNGKGYLIELATLYAKSEFPKDHHRAFQICSAIVREYKDSSSQRNKSIYHKGLLLLGRFYSRGIGTKIDEEKAIECFKKTEYLLLNTIDKSCHYEQYLYGQHLLKRNNRFEMTERARNFLEKSSDNGNKYASFLLGKELFRGINLYENVRMSVVYIIQAARQGHKEAIKVLEGNIGYIDPVYNDKIYASRCKSFYRLVKQQIKPEEIANLRNKV